MLPTVQPSAPTLVPTSALPTASSPTTPPTLPTYSTYYIQWTAVGPPGYWYGLTISTDGSHLAGIPDGYSYLYRSEDGGNAWIETATELGKQHWYYLTATSDGKYLAAMSIPEDNTANALFLSSDHGKSWSSPTVDSSSWGYVKYSSSGAALVAFSAFGYAYTSLDHGNTWTEVDYTLPWAAVTASSDGKYLATVMAVNTGIYYSLDAGASWGISGPTGNWIAITSSADGSRLASLLGVTNTTCVPYLSSDYGATWTAAKNTVLDYVSGFVTLSSSDDGAVVAASLCTGLYISTDCGLTWRPPALSSQQWLSVTVSSDASFIAVGTADKVLIGSPTPLPSASPTPLPTAPPSVSPSRNPHTKKPTSNPITAVLTTHPTAKPTVGPTSKPSLRPSAKATVRPTVVPVKKSSPSARPSTSPVKTTGPSARSSKRPSLRSNRSTFEPIVVSYGS